MVAFAPNACPGSSQLLGTVTGTVGNFLFTRSSTADVRSRDFSASTTCCLARTSVAFCSPATSVTIWRTVSRTLVMDLVERLIQDALARLDGTLDIGDLLLEFPPLLREIVGRQDGALPVQLLLDRAKPVLLLGDLVLIGFALCFELLLNVPGRSGLLEDELNVHDGDDRRRKLGQGIARLPRHKADSRRNACQTQDEPTPERTFRQHRSEPRSEAETELFNLVVVFLDDREGQIDTDRAERRPPGNTDAGGYAEGVVIDKPLARSGSRPLRSECRYP